MQIIPCLWPYLRLRARVKLPLLKAYPACNHRFNGYRNDDKGWISEQKIT